MTFPPPQTPPPDGYRPVSPQPPAMGPGGAYGPVGVPAGQPVPGQMPSAEMTMPKPGTITGIQVILWIFLAIGVVGDAFSIISLVDAFHPIGLLVVAYTLYVTVQSLVTPIHIGRGRRWAWIWNVVSTVIGLVFSAVGIVFGIILIEYGVLSLVFGLVFAALNGTLLGLLCSRSARQWILMNRVRRGEAHLTGMPGPAGAAGVPPPERPATRPGAATVAVIAVWLFAALCAWSLWVNVKGGLDTAAAFEYVSLPGAFLDSNFLWTRGFPTVICGVLLLCSLICAPGLMKGAAAARIFGVVWSVFAVLLVGFMFVFLTIDYFEYRHFIPPWEQSPYPLAFARHTAMQVVAIAILVLMFVPGLRRWTPRKPAAIMVVTVPAGGPGTGAYLPQPGAPAPQGYVPQQQRPPHPPQY